MRLAARFGLDQIDYRVLVLRGEQERLSQEIAYWALQQVDEGATRLTRWLEYDIYVQGGKRMRVLGDIRHSISWIPQPRVYRA